MVPNEEDGVERFIGGIPDNIQGNVIAANPARFQDVIRIANQLMDKKLQGYAARSAESKRRMESNLRDNRRRQPPFKRQNISGQNVVRAYTTGNNVRKGYTGPHPLYNKCKYHHVGPYTVKCNNCKKVGHLTRDCTTTITPNTQRAPVGNQQGVICYECGRPGHFRKDCPKLRNQNRGNETRNMLNDFDKEDLIVLYRLFNEKYASTRPGFDDLMLWGDMKVMFEPDSDDAVWKNHNSQELIEWKLYDSCEVYSLMLGEVSIHMLVEKKYPLPQDTLTRMLQWKLHVNYNVIEMAYKLLRFIRSQLNQ
ncbi:putative reverse transcriptase domain-containing protein [Tanacetum coccineum]